MAVYKHGVYSQQENSEFSSPTAMGTIPAYIGILPVQRFNANGDANFDYSPYVNAPILVNSYNDVRAAYSDDFETYSLCEAVSAHFLNGNSTQSPIILINMFDPKTMAASEAETDVPITLLTEGANKVGYIDDTTAMLDGIAITPTSGSLTVNTDYTLSYEGDRIKITITKTGFSEASVKATYKTVDVTKAATAANMDKALEALDHCEMATGYIPNVIAAPGLSEQKDIHDKMIAKISSKISGKWNFIIVSDIPSSETTAEDAIEWKSTNGYNSKYDKVCWPSVTYGGKTYHLSTIATYTMQMIDTDNDDVPYVSPSNKTIYADGSVVDGASIYIPESTANKLNENGITTVNIIRRSLRLWGSNMANYDFAKLDSINAEDRSDANVRMMLYLLNYLQYNYIDEIDTAFTRKDIDSVLTSVQQWLNSLVNEGKLLYATISFNESENSTASMIDGDFVFNVETTLTPNAKSITFKVKYTTDGILLLTGEGGTE